MGILGEPRKHPFLDRQGEKNIASIPRKPYNCLFLDRQKEKAIARDPNDAQQAALGPHGEGAEITLSSTGRRKKDIARDPNDAQWTLIMFVPSQVLRIT